MTSKTLQTKIGSGYVTDDGQTIPEHTLYRFVDENGKGGCWYSTLERAERSWAMRQDSAAAPDLAAEVADALTPKGLR